MKPFPDEWSPFEARWRLPRDTRRSPCESRSFKALTSLHPVRVPGVQA